MIISSLILEKPVGFNEKAELSKIKSVTHISFQLTIPDIETLKGYNGLLGGWTDKCRVCIL